MSYFGSTYMDNSYYSRQTKLSRMLVSKNDILNINNYLINNFKENEKLYRHIFGINLNEEIKNDIGIDAYGDDYDDLEEEYSKDDEDYSKTKYKIRIYHILFSAISQNNLFILDHYWNNIIINIYEQPDNDGNCHSQITHAVNKYINDYNIFKNTDPNLKKENYDTIIFILERQNIMYKDNINLITNYVCYWDDGVLLPDILNFSGYYNNYELISTLLNNYNKPDSLSECYRICIRENCQKTFDWLIENYINDIDFEWTIESLNFKERYCNSCTDEDIEMQNYVIEKMKLLNITVYEKIMHLRYVTDESDSEDDESVAKLFNENDKKNDTDDK